MSNHPSLLDHDKHSTVTVRVFLDTQYTNHQTPQLISFGLAAGVGRMLYAEMADGWHSQDCAEFVLSNVIPGLGRHPADSVTRVQAAEQIADWLDGSFTAAIRVRTGRTHVPACFSKVIEIVALHTLDLELLSALPGFMEKLRELPFKIKFVSVRALPAEEVDSVDVLSGINRFFETDSAQLPRHHAMNGALALSYGVRLAQLTASAELCSD